MVAAPARTTADRLLWLLSLLLGALFVLWAVHGLIVEPMRFAVFAPSAYAGLEAATVVARLLGALALLFLAADRATERLRWVAAGFGLLALGLLVFRFSPLNTAIVPRLGTIAYACLTLRAAAAALFAVGLVPRTAPRLGRRLGLLVFLLVGTLLLGVFVAGDFLPPLVRGLSPAAAVASNRGPLTGLTAWHWLFSIVVLGVSVVTALGTARHVRAGTLGGWLLLAMVLQVGLQLHNLFWLPIDNLTLTTGGLLRFASVVVVASGAYLELRRHAAERALQLVRAEEQAKRLTELARLRADFTAMVAHELGNPVAAIRGLAEVLATGPLDPDHEASALGAIRNEASMLTALIADVHTAATVERDDFAVDLRPIPLTRLVADAVCFAGTLCDHPLRTNDVAPVRVWADDDRIGQVLRNLLCNAAKYTPAGTQIELRTVMHGRRVRVEVRDYGPGIDPSDLTRILEKFQRGRDQAGGKVPGVGLGLYLSRRIAQAHGTDLVVESTRGVGSMFAFELEVAP